MTILGITYHYVRPGSPEVPGLRYLHLDDFRKQLDWLCDSRRPISSSEFLDIIKGNEKVTDGFVLTFDDGLLDHYEFVFPELTKRGLWGAFYVPVGPYLDNRSLDVHQVHALLGIFGGTKVLDELNAALSSLGIFIDESISSNRYSQADDDEAIIRVKRKLNYELPIELRSIVINRVCDQLNYELKVSDWYMSTKQMQEMVNAGMIIGSHSVTHRPMRQLPPESQGSEIQESFSWLERTLGAGLPRSFCYPYGGFDTFSIETEVLLGKAGALWSFNTEEREISQLDVLERPQALPRFDCCNLPHGASRKPIN